MTTPNTTACAIWCTGPILIAVQSARLFNDSKDFVDSPLLVPPDECWQRWRALPQPPPAAALADFVNTTFGPPGGGLEPWDPPDFTPSPPLLAQLPAGPLREWASALNNLWPQLGRRCTEAVLRSPERSTLLPVRRPFIVPGGRFREAYYWDSYWVVLGLLEVGMWQTAEGVASNLLDAVDEHGFVPNGLRSYYLNRSQPPLLTQMVAALLGALAGRGGAAMSSSADGDGEGCESSSSSSAAAAASLLQRALPLLDREYAWWMRNGTNGSSASAVPLPGGHAVLNRYVVAASGPRPESWREDAATAAGLDEDAATRVFSELAAAAESGWDFSSRWLNSTWQLEGAAVEAAEAAEVQAEAEAEAAPPLRSIATSEVLPVELNAILYRNERSLHDMHARLASLLLASTTDASASAAASAASAAADAERYAAAAAGRLQAMDTWMWDATSGRWHDVLWARGERLEQESAASYTPLWAGAYSDGAQAAAAVAALRASTLLQAGGVATTLPGAGGPALPQQQWDWPNAWPPLQQMIVEGLEACGAPGAGQLARQLAARWLASNALGWKKEKLMHEKYDATAPGQYGGGGEYTPQVGFGWSNGVVLWLLAKYCTGDGALGEAELGL